MAIRPFGCPETVVELCGPVAHEFAPDAANIAGRPKVARANRVSARPLTPPPQPPSCPHPMRYLRHLYVQVLIAVVLGSLLGHFQPAVGASLQPLGEGFIKLVKMLIAPIVFTTIVSGIGGMRNLRKVGRVGLKALVYFEVLTTLALLIGLAVVNWIQPGAGIHANAAELASGANATAATTYAAAGQKLSTVDFILNLIPSTFLGAFASGEILQVLLLAVLTGIVAAQLGDKARPVLDLLDVCFKLLMRIVALIMYLAPLAAFGAMAFTVGKYGLGSLASLAKLLLSVYLTMAVFIVVVLGGILRYLGLSLTRYLRFIREEILLVLGTSSSEPALPGMLAKLEHLGCAKPVVSLVLPTGYSFNLDGTCIYLTMAAVFIAQATDTPLTLWQQLGIVSILLLTSKGAAAVTGGGFVTLSATLASTHTVPVSGLSLIIGIDRFMSEARAVTNLIGNGVAVIAVSAWEGELDRARARRVLAGEEPADTQVELARV
jgi:aerobic C4-dicarboxylate transport protein